MNGGAAGGLVTSPLTVVALPAASESGRALVERRLAELCRQLQRELGIDGLAEALAYSVLAPGKRVRPLLVLATAEACGGDAANAVDLAVAVELIHTYSLVHDDLPCMDDDDLRRGRPTSHRRFGEGVAVLVGDALQAEAFRVVAEAPQLADRDRGSVAALLARAAGARGMVGGQYLDIEQVGDTGSVEGALDRVRRIHARKTGALLSASVVLGTYAVSGVDPQVRSQFAAFGDAVGWLFQLVDDLLDLHGSETSTGKTHGSDQRQQKTTALDVLGEAGLRRAIADQLRECRRLAGSLPGGGGDLPALATYVAARDR